MVYVNVSQDERPDTTHTRAHPHNRLLQVTPSSKCVGDLAIYLVTRGLSVADVKDEKKAGKIDFPASVIELLEGRLGFPHRGFPTKVQKAILKDRTPLAVSPSAALAPADFAAEKARLDGKWAMDTTPEDVISSLLYPKVFNDYCTFLQQHGPGPRYLPTPAFYYGLDIGEASVRRVASRLFFAWRGVVWCGVCCVVCLSS